MASPNAQKIARTYFRAQTASKGRGKTAGEVRFVKDRSSDKNEWGWGSPGPSEREISENFEFKPGRIKPLAQVLRSILMALGHATSAHSRFVKVKSRNVSPDGNLGGKGYIQKIPEMRRQIMNVVEVLSSTSDTLYDELHAPHWQPGPETGNRERDEVEEILEDAQEIKDDPEAWAEEQEEEMDEENEQESKGKKASATPCLEANLAKLASSADEFTRLLRAGSAENDLRLQVEAEVLRILASDVAKNTLRVFPTPSAKRVASRYLEIKNV